MKHVIFLSAALPENLGDFVLKNELCNELSKLASVYALVDGSADGGCKLKGAVVLDKPEFVRKFLLCVLNPTIRVFIYLAPGGGGIRNTPFLASFRALRSLLPNAIFWCLRIKVVKLGVSSEESGPVKFSLYNWLLSSFRIFTGYRDTGSLTEGRNSGERHIALFPDLSFLLGSRCETSSEPNTVKRKFVCSFRECHFTLGFDRDYDSNIVGLLRGLVEAFERDEVVFCSQTRRDDVYVQKLGAECGDCSVERFFSYDIDSFLQFYSGFSYVVSNRLHVLLIAAFAGCVPIAIVSKEENRKIVSLFSDNDLEDLCIDVHSPDVLGEVKSIVNRGDTKYVRERIKDIANQNADEIVAILRKIHS